MPDKQRYGRGASGASLLTSRKTCSACVRAFGSPSVSSARSFPRRRQRIPGVTECAAAQVAGRIRLRVLDPTSCGMLRDEMDGSMGTLLSLFVLRLIPCALIPEMRFVAPGPPMSVAPSARTLLSRKNQNFQITEKRKKCNNRMKGNDEKINESIN